MRNSKLVHLLQLLTSADQKAFGEFLISPYFNKRAEVARLYEILEKQFLGNKKKDLGEEKVFEMMFADKAFDPNSFRKLKSRLLKLLLEFFTIHNLQDQPAKQFQLLLNELNGRAEEKYFLSYYNEAQKVLEKTPSSAEDSFENQLQTELELTRFLTRQSTRTQGTNMEKVLRVMEQNQKIRLLKFAYLGLNQSNVVKGQQELEKTHTILSTLNFDEENNPPIIQLYFHLYQGMMKPLAEDHYFEIKKLLNAHSESIAQKDAIDIYHGAINYCIRQINAGKRHFLGELLQLYQEMLSRKIILVADKLPPLQFKNMVTLGSRLGEFDWTESLIQKYTHHLAGGENPNAVAYCNGILSFYQGKMDAARRFLTVVLSEYDDVYYGLDSRVYLLKIYFETQDLAGMESLTESFRLFLMRNKLLPSARREKYQLFIRLFRRLYQLTPNKEEKWQKLKQDILMASSAISKEWLLEKVETGAV